MCSVENDGKGSGTHAGPRSDLRKLCCTKQYEGEPRAPWSGQPPYRRSAAKPHEEALHAGSPVTGHCTTPDISFNVHAPKHQKGSGTLSHFRIGPIAHPLPAGASIAFDGGVLVLARTMREQHFRGCTNSAFNVPKLTRSTGGVMTTRAAVQPPRVSKVGSNCPPGGAALKPVSGLPASRAN